MAAGDADPAPRRLRRLRVAAGRVVVAVNVPRAGVGHELAAVADGARRLGRDRRLARHRGPPRVVARRRVVEALHVQRRLGVAAPGVVEVRRHGAAARPKGGEGVRRVHGRLDGLGVAVRIARFAQALVADAPYDHGWVVAVPAHERGRLVGLAVQVVLVCEAAGGRRAGVTRNRAHVDARITRTHHTHTAPVHTRTHPTQGSRGGPRRPTARVSAGCAPCATR